VDGHGSSLRTTRTVPSATPPPRSPCGVADADHSNHHGDYSTTVHSTAF
jgi:hypothetical protein